MERIQEPMDLSTIKLKIDRRKYKTLDDFEADLKLMLSNCFKFHEMDSVEFNVSVFSIVNDCIW